MTSEELEVGGAWYEARLELEEVARLLGADDFKVAPFDQYQGPACFVFKNNINAKLFLHGDEGFVLWNEDTNNQITFLKEEASVDLWKQLI